MDSKNITKAVCEIAKTFEEKGDLFVVQLLKETGYLERPEMITEDEILKCLKQHPDLLDTWVLYSENQRIPEGWYIKTPVENDSSSITWKVG